jgi:hypothetical protein
MSTPGPLGWIEPIDRTPQQNAAHADAVAKMPKFAIRAPEVTGPANVRLFEFWSKQQVVQEVGFVFPRFHQITGSCVGAGGGNALFTLIAVQRLLSQGATRAFVPWWPFDYGKSRLRMGDRGQGEGSLGSTFAEAVVKDGVMSAAESGLPQFSNSDGLTLTQQLEMQWSDGDSQTVSKYDSVAKEHPLGTAAPVNSVEEIRAALVNGYPITFACNNYIGNAKVEGSGADACVIGYWDGRGGHQQSLHAVWDHPGFGPLYWAQNNWPGSTYPKDPAGGPICGCWVREEKVKAALRLDAEVYALSHLDYFPAQNVIDWLM